MYPLPRGVPPTSYLLPPTSHFPSPTTSYLLPPYLPTFYFLQVTMREVLELKLKNPDGTSLRWADLIKQACVPTCTHMHACECMYAGVRVCVYACESPPVPPSTQPTSAESSGK